MFVHAPGRLLTNSDRLEEAKGRSGSEYRLFPGSSFFPSTVTPTLRFIHKPKGVNQRLSCNRIPRLEFHSIIHPFPDPLSRSISGSQAQHSTRILRHTKFTQHRLGHRAPSPRISTAVESKVVHNKAAWETFTRADVGKGKKEFRGRKSRKSQSPPLNHVDDACASLNGFQVLGFHGFMPLLDVLLRFLFRVEGSGGRATKGLLQ